ncbi:hypothetical protein ACQEVZ_55540 [Dactylosporangium sp. CA-152071]|uniref:hypothetical protein n=1 Tax=Dactylosporangium sp. CA-152071 TaxID=3239933 RepID=UPI003D8B5C2C
MNLNPSTVMPVDQLRIGQPVHVNSRTAWLPAVVTSIARTAVGVELRTPGETPLTGVVPPWVIRPADGVRLLPVQRASSGDQVFKFDGTTQTVAAPAWEGRDGWWFVTFTDGHRACLPAGTVLRLVDDTPSVTVNGQPLNY